MTGLSITRTNRWTEKIYFGLGPSESPLDRLREAARLCGLSDADWSPLIQHRDVLSSSQTLLSLAYDSGTRVPGLKLDVQGMSRHAIHQLLEGPMLAREIDVDNFAMASAARGHVSLRMTPGETIRVKVSASSVLGGEQR